MSMDVNWDELKGGYRIPYDPRAPIARLRAAPLDGEAWDELWNELHHQGDVGEASYAAVPLLVEACEGRERDWNFHGLIATIEVERHCATNPELPDSIAPAYHAALHRARELALADLAITTDRLVIRCAVALVALASGERELGSLVTILDASEIRDLLEHRMAWGRLYERAR